MYKYTHWHWFVMDLYSNTFLLFFPKWTTSSNNMPPSTAKKLPKPKLSPSSSWTKKIKKLPSKNNHFLKDQMPSNNRNLFIKILGSVTSETPKGWWRKKSLLMKSWTKPEKCLKWRKKWKTRRKRDFLRKSQENKKERKKGSRNSRKRQERTRRTLRKKSRYNKT